MSACRSRVRGASQPKQTPLFFSFHRSTAKNFSDFHCASIRFQAFIASVFGTFRAEWRTRRRGEIVHAVLACYWLTSFPIERVSVGIEEGKGRSELIVAPLTASTSWFFDWPTGLRNHIVPSCYSLWTESTDCFIKKGIARC